MRPWELLELSRSIQSKLEKLSSDLRKQVEQGEKMRNDVDVKKETGRRVGFKGVEIAAATGGAGLGLGAGVVGVAAAEFAAGLGVGLGGVAIGVGGLLLPVVPLLIAGGAASAALCAGAAVAGAKARECHAKVKDVQALGKYLEGAKNLKVTLNHMLDHWRSAFTKFESWAKEAEDENFDPQEQRFQDFVADCERVSKDLKTIWEAIGSTT
ncbi:hypothetical protein HK102_000998 [Quaeritorhiza haematococci]|nr:hypothetical protein HK102_000998 [Quaeritorhiza haematococci]